MFIGLAALIFVTAEARESPSQSTSEMLAIPENVETIPPRLYEGGEWRQTEIATGSVLGTTRVLGATRIPDGYAFPTRDGVVVLLDEGGAVRTRLPELRTLRGIAADSTRVVAYGTAESPQDRFPTLWESNDGLTWTTRSVPWQGAVQAVAFDGSQMLIAGVRSGLGGLSGVLARESPGGGWNVTEIPIPTSALFAVNNGFVVRARIDDQTGFSHYFTTDFETFAFFADSMLISAPGRAAGVVEVDGSAALQIEGREEPLVPPDWPVASVWIEGPRIWVQTPTSLWTTLDGVTWDELGLDRSSWHGPAMAIPVGDDARIAVSDRTGVVRIYEWVRGG